MVRLIHLKTDKDENTAVLIGPLYSNSKMVESDNSATWTKSSYLPQGEGRTS